MDSMFVLRCVLGRRSSYVITRNYLDCYLDYLEVIWITWFVTGITWNYMEFMMA